MKCPYCKYELAPISHLEPYELCVGLCSSFDNVHPVLQYSEYHQRFVIIHLSFREGNHLYRLTICPILETTSLVALKHPLSQYGGPEALNYPFSPNNKVFELGWGRQLIHPHNHIKDLLVLQIPHVKDYTPLNVRSKVKKLLLFT
jgi:hypothetical protein